MTEQIPTPTPEQVQQWLNHLAGDTRRRTLTTDDFLLAACAAEWGANKELDACCEWVQGYAECGDSLRAARRPQPKPDIIPKPQFPPPRTIREDFLP